ncbi:MAG: NADH-quinone oxidoreductase subunit L [Alphaproteobacteria bacterium]|nr:NADH-quinone oxidoreductase subunit L [Alphaproteobacteria bacterium]
MKTLAILAVFLPLLGFVLAGLPIVAGAKGHGVDRWAQLITSALVGVAALCAVAIFWSVALHHQPRTIELFTWIDSGSFEAGWALKLDALSAVMLCVVTIVSTCVHVYSIGYMSHDPAIPRFMAYLSLFTFFMLMLVTADNFVQMFFGWEGVGLASYLLIGFWHDRDSANAASIKAFVVNRVGDFGFALGIFGVFAMFGSVHFDTVFQAAPGRVNDTIRFLWFEGHALTTLCLLLFVGAMGKSAQLGLHTWLPDAMEGPTPVSALIHAATMVTAGVFMVARLSPMFELAPAALNVVCIIGALTAIFAASVGLVQNDIKRVIAYSTCSQLGYMFFAAGVSAYSAAIFHLMTHAFFKALLFLGSGSVIHALEGEQDMRKMGGLGPKIRITYWLMLIGSVALAGIGIPFVFGFAGFYSKDIILESAFGAHSGPGAFAFWIGIAAAGMTAFYSWRLLFMTFSGHTRADHHTFDHAHESPAVMLVPLYVLAAGAIFAGLAGYEYFVGHHRAEFWGASIKVLAAHDSIEAAHHVPVWVKVLPLVASVIGIGVSYGLYIRNPQLPAELAARFQGLYRFLLNKWWFDELYDALFVRPSFTAGIGLWKKGDGAIIDGLGPDALAANTLTTARRVSAVQTGYVYHYAFAMLIGVVALATWYLVSR